MTEGPTRAAIPAATGGTAHRGRRDPALAANLRNGAAPGPTADLMVGPDGDVHVDPRGTILPMPRITRDGDVVSAATTLAVDLDTGGVSYFRYEHRTTVGTDETEAEVYERVATVTNDGVINLIDDVQDRIEQHNAELAARAAQQQ